MKLVELLRPADCQRVENALKKFKTVVIKGHSLDGKQYIVGHLNYKNLKPGEVPEHGLYLANFNYQAQPERLLDTTVIELEPIKKLTFFCGSLINFHESDISITDFQTKLEENCHGFYESIIANTGNILNGEAIQPTLQSLEEESANILLSFALNFGLSFPANTFKEIFPNEYKILRDEFYICLKNDKFITSSYAQAVSNLLHLDPDNMNWKLIETLQKLNEIDDNHIQAALSYLRSDKDKLISIINADSNSYRSNYQSLIEETLLSTDSLISLFKNFKKYSQSEIEVWINILEKRYQDQSLNRKEKLSFITTLKLYNHLNQSSKGIFEVEDITYFEKSLEFRRQGKTSAAIEQMDLAIESADDERTKAEFTNAQAINFLQDGKFIEAVKLFNQTTASFRALHLNGYAQISLFNTAVCHENLGEWQKAGKIIDNLLSESIVDPTLQYSISNYQCYLFSKQGLYQFAKELSEETLSKNNLTHSQRVFAMAYQVESLIHLNQTSQLSSQLKELELLIQDFPSLRIKFVSNLALKSFVSRNKRDAESALKELNQLTGTLPSKYMLDFLVAEFYLKETLGEPGLDLIIERIEKLNSQLESPNYVFDTALLKFYAADSQTAKVQALNLYKQNAEQLNLRNRIQFADNQLINIQAKADGNIISSHNSQLTAQGLFSQAIIQFKNGSSHLENTLIQLNRSIAHNSDELTPAHLEIINSIIFQNNLSERVNFILQKTGNSDNLQKEFDLKLEPIIKLSSGNKEYISISDYLKLTRSAQFDLFMNDFEGVTLYKGKKLEIQSGQIIYKLIRFFLENADKGVSKEELISYIWREEYNPLIHDSYIYQAVHKLKGILNGEEIISSSNDKYRLSHTISRCLISKNMIFDMSLSKRQLWALYYLKYNDQLTAAAYSKEHETSSRTAQRDLSDLVSKGLLTVHGKGRGQYYTIAYS